MVRLPGMGNNGLIVTGMAIKPDGCGAS